MTKTELKNLKRVQQIIAELEEGSCITLTDEFGNVGIFSCSDCKREVCPPDCIVKPPTEKPATLEEASKLCENRQANLCLSEYAIPCQRLRRPQEGYRCCYSCSCPEYCPTRCTMPEDIVDEMAGLACDGGELTYDGFDHLITSQEKAYFRATSEEQHRIFKSNLGWLLSMKKSRKEDRMHARAQGDHLTPFLPSTPQTKGGLGYFGLCAGTVKEVLSEVILREPTDEEVHDFADYAIGHLLDTLFAVCHDYID